MKTKAFSGLLFRYSLERMPNPKKENSFCHGQDDSSFGRPDARTSRRGLGPVERSRGLRVGVANRNADQREMLLRIPLQSNLLFDLYLPPPANLEEEYDPQIPKHHPSLYHCNIHEAVFDNPTQAREPDEDFESTAY